MGAGEDDQNQSAPVRQENSVRKSEIDTFYSYTYMCNQPLHKLSIHMHTFIHTYIHKYIHTHQLLYPNILNANGNSYAKKLFNTICIYPSAYIHTVHKYIHIDSTSIHTYIHTYLALPAGEQDVQQQQGGDARHTSNHSAQEKKGLRKK